MTTVANFEKLYEAEALQEILKSAGINTVIPEIRRRAKAADAAISRIRLQVLENDADKAVQIINRAFSIVD